MQETDSITEDSGESSGVGVPELGELFVRLPALYLVVLPDAPRFTIVGATDSYARALRLGPHELTGRALFEVLPEDTDDAPRRALRNLRTSLKRVLDTRAADTMPIQRLAGIPGDELNERYWAPVNTPLLNTHGDIDCIVHEITDVTAMRRQAIADADAARATSELALLEAEEAARAKTSFLANMSHELRTPLNAIQGYAQLLEIGVAGSLTDAQKEYVSRLTSSAVHLKTLVDEVLDLAKVDAGQLQVSRDDASTSDAVAAACSLTAPQAKERGVRIIEESGGKNYSYVGDAARVRQILINLLDNAIKFTPRGGEVRIRSAIVDELPPHARLSGPGPWACISVRDTGIGIAAEHHRTIFEPFVQVDDRLTRNAGGTGLGLTISSRLARLMGGDLSMTSAPGEGSTFYLWLPTSAAQSERSAGANASLRRARAVQDTAGPHVRGFVEIARKLRHDAGDLVERWAERVRRDTAIPNGRTTEPALIIDHVPTFVVNLAQNLMTVEESAGIESGKLQDGGEIQRSISELHGQQRQRLGWSEESLGREYDSLFDELSRWLQELEGSEGWNVRTASEVLRHLMDRARESGLAAYRRASRNDG